MAFSTRRFYVYATGNGTLSAVLAGDKQKQTNLASKGFQMLSQVNLPPRLTSKDYVYVGDAYKALMRVYDL